MEARRGQEGFASIIGQEAVIHRLKDFAALYSAAGATPGHVLLAGPDGIGKRTLARAFAAEYCTAVIDLDAGSVTKTGDLVGALTNLAANSALLVTDIGRMPKTVAPLLREAAAQFKVDFVLDKGPFAKTVSFALKMFTCIGTAPSEGACPRELREMFALVLGLQHYSQLELVALCGRLAERKGMQLTASAATLIGSTCGGLPHDVDVWVSRLAAVFTGPVTENDVRHILSIHGVTTGGGTSERLDLGSLSGVAFEAVIARLLRRMGFHTEMTKASGDGGVDIIATLDRPLTGGRYLIQCKRFAAEKPVDAATVREFHGALSADPMAVKGILVTTSGFTAQAQQFARQLRIELIAGDQLRRLFEQHGMKTDESPPLFDQAGSVHE
jgi:DNA polymerase III delta prime subunit